MHYKKKVVPKLQHEVKVKVDIVTSDDIKIHYTGKFKDFTARYIINHFSCNLLINRPRSVFIIPSQGHSLSLSPRSCNFEISIISDWLANHKVLYSQMFLKLKKKAGEKRTNTVFLSLKLRTFYSMVD